MLLGFPQQKGAEALQVVVGEVGSLGSLSFILFAAHPSPCDFFTRPCLGLSHAEWLLSLSAVADISEKLSMGVVVSQVGYVFCFSFSIKHP